MLVVTTDNVPRHEIDVCFGPVAARVPNAKAGIGGKGLDRAAAETMAALTAALSEAADRLGADAIVGLRVVPESMTTFGYGTAVKLA